MGDAFNVVHGVQMTITAVVPILPALYSLVMLFSAGALSMATLVGLCGTAERRAMICRFLWRQRYSLLILTALAGLSAGLFYQLFLRETPSTRNYKQVTLHRAGDWSMFRGSQQRGGVVAGSPLPLRDATIWTGGRGDRFYASPAVAEGRVFGLGVRGDASFVYCWDARNGRLLWGTRPAGLRGTFASPVIAGDFLFSGEGFHHTPRGRVLCLDLRPGHEGEVVWTFRTNSHVECTPWVADGRVIVAAGDDGIYALRSDPRSTDAERVIWHASGDRFPDAETCLAVDKKQVYVGLGEGGAAICVLDVVTGSELGRVPMPYPVYAPPALDDGRLYVGMGHGNYINHSAAGGGQVVCLDTATRSVQWIFPTPATVFGAIVVDRERVIFTCADGLLRALDLNGRLQQTWNCRAAVVSSPAVSGDMMYVVNTAGELLAFNCRQEEPVWQRRLGGAGAYLSSPVVALGHVYVGTEADGFQCVGAAPADEQAASPVTREVDVPKGVANRAPELNRLRRQSQDHPDGTDRDL